MMEFLQRVKRRSAKIMRMRPSNMVPAASVRKEIRAGQWSKGKPWERLARLADAVLENLDGEPVLAARFDGHKGLKFAKTQAVSIGTMGGKSWKSFNSSPIDPSQLESLSGTDEVCEQGLEILDLTDLQICDWKGGLAEPQVARLALLSPLWRPSASGGPAQYYGLVMDFDQRLLDANSVVKFMDLVIGKLLPEKGA